MGFFFLLAGYFTPARWSGRATRASSATAFLRLGLPLLAFGLILGPLTAAIVNYAQGDGFWSTFGWLWRHREFINGPLWFAQALLIFSLAYCAWRAIAGSPLASAERTPTPVPAYRWWLLSALGVGAPALAIRQVVPTGQNVFGLQLAYFAGYIFLFAAGHCRVALRLAAPTYLEECAPLGLDAPHRVAAALPLGMIAIRAFTGNPHPDTTGGLSWASVLYAFWEPFVAWGLIARGCWSSANMNQPSNFWNWLNRRAYAVYIIHPPVLVGIALLLHGWVAPALVKFAVVGMLACIATWLASDPLVRLPGVRSVV
jgi:peptidoglycan/LPS O-acetylase OafA/YrhL